MIHRPTVPTRPTALTVCVYSLF